jgi:rhomboid protease GluP
MELSPRLRFKLERIKRSLRQTFGSSEDKYESAIRMCPHCRAFFPRNASVCPDCGTPVKAPRSRPTTSTPGRVLGIIPVPSTATSVIIAVNIALYGISWYLSQSLTASTGVGGEGGGISPPVLLRLGAKFGPAIFFGHQWWRLVTAIFLHGGLLHIGMNMWCLFDLGPAVESMFGTAKFLTFYLVTGVVGFIFSCWWTPTLSIGASGAILGLIGILIGASFHHGSIGREYRRQLWRWVIYIAILGLLPAIGLLPIAIDNGSHIGGFLSGLLLGYLVAEGEPITRSGETLWNGLALLTVIVIAGSFALMALHLNPR